ncbi:MAG: YlbF family regulator [Anaerovoracaceae bacterium]
MQNIHDVAHELARALKESEQYRHYKEMKEKISQNEELTAMINDFQEKNMAIQTQQMLEGKLSEEMMEQVQALYQIVMADPLAAQYIQSEVAFTQIVSDIYGIIGEVIRFE